MCMCVQVRKWAHLASHRIARRQGRVRRWLWLAGEWQPRRLQCLPLLMTAATSMAMWRCTTSRWGGAGLVGAAPGSAHSLQMSQWTLKAEGGDLGDTMSWPTIGLFYLTAFLRSSIHLRMFTFPYRQWMGCNQFGSSSSSSFAGFGKLFQTWTTKTTWLSHPSQKSLR